MAEKQTSNQVTVYKAREDTIGVLDATANFETREPNSFDDFGGEPTQVARRPFSPSRQRKKGSNVDLDVTAGWNEDFTANNMYSILDGFCFAAIRAKPKLASSAATAATDRYTVAAGGAAFVVGSIILASGFANAANNGIKVVTESAAAYVGVGAAGALVDDAVGGTIEVVGFEFGAGELSLNLDGGVCRLVAATMDFTTYGLIPGEWVIVGGDAADEYFTTVLRGYARIGVDGVTADELVFDKTSFTPVDNAGAGQTIRLFFGPLVKNEDDPDLIVKLTDTIERPLGRDDDGKQSEVITGATPNEITWNSPLAALVNVDVGYVGLSVDNRKGVDGLLSESGTHTISAGLGEDGWNTSRNLYRCRVAVIDPLTLNPTPMFGKVTEFSLTLNNNVSPDKAQGVYGAFDTTEGMFEVDAEMTAYFRDMAAKEAIDEDTDVTFDVIYSKQNRAFIFDVPLVSVGGGVPEVEQNTAIMLPLTTAAAESPFGHTVLFNWFPYAPDYAMARGTGTN